MINMTLHNKEHPGLYPLFLVGLTGSMGCGKSVVGQMLSQWGARVIDTDQIARQVIAPGSAGLKAVISRFGSHFLERNPASPPPGLDRKKMAAHIFSHPEDRIAYESMLHVWILQTIRAQLLHLLQSLQHATEIPTQIAILEVPLLFESGWDQLCDLTVTVACGQQQWQRLASRHSMSDTVKRQVLAVQLPEAEKKRQASHIIDNSGSLEATTLQVKHFWTECQRLAHHHRRPLWPEIAAENH
ncbi:MAG: dephospho-CoA kinase [Magnetococcales bacterium]|nr:dephospho-CoA kinase [Magnetococcales bacterium]